MDFFSIFFLVIASECCGLLLSPSDPLFNTIGTLFLQIQTEHFGTDHIYNTDTFNENRPTNNDPNYLSGMSKSVYMSMYNADKNAIWLMQAWLFIDTDFWKQEQIKGLLDGVPNESMILLDLYADSNPFWSQTNLFYGKSFIWVNII
jgi:alpha-N-acetylglucosaminidase